MESAHCLSRAIKSHACINQLVFTHCDLGSDPEILLVILQSDVNHIILDNNNIDSLGAVKIAESGVRDVNDAQSLRNAGYDAVLVGESLIISNDPAAVSASLRVTTNKN